MAGTHRCEAPQVYHIGPRRYPLWPNDTEATSIAAAIKMARFPDHRDINAALRDRILAEEARLRAESPPRSRALGGQKLRRPDRWDSPAFQLLHARALALFRNVLKCPEAHVGACWINVYRHGESIGPHSHRRAKASLVYMLDAGDPDAECAISGRFCIADPRLDLCAQMEPGCLSHPCYPEMPEGAMLIFPAQVVHYVPAYFGRRPRITVSWNLSDRPLEGSQADAIKAARRQAEA